MFSKRKLSAIGLAVTLAMFAAGCKKKVPPPPPPPPPAATAPTTPPPAAAPVVASFTVEPTTIQSGQSATLRWEVTGTANSVSINNGIGAVQNTGNRRVSPTSSTTYTLTATGPGGEVTSSATVTVVTPPPPPPPAATQPTVSLDQRISSDLQDVYFDYDKSDVRGDARDVLNRNVTALKSILADFPSSTIVLEGHCDERGSAEYNLGLGDRRSSSVKEFLVQLGIPDNRLKTISYGKERPVCNESDESCWQKNRRVHFAPGQ